MKYPLGVVVAPFTLALAILGVLASPALATHTEPAKAKKVTFAFVNGFAPCSAPNSAMQANGFSACHHRSIPSSLSVVPSQRPGPVS